MDAKLPHFLLVEDDLTTAHFFQAVLQPLPATIDWARSSAQALHYAQTQTYDLWLIDLNLPDGTGLELLSRLRAQHGHIVALAHTAELNFNAKPALQQAGFIEILIKPFSAQTLLNLVQNTLKQKMNRHWNDAIALNALGGQVQHMNSLRQLFLDELPATCAAVHQALEQNDEIAVKAYLHRLKASCGFVGAVQLGQAIRQLQQIPHSSVARQQFDDAVVALLH